MLQEVSGETREKFAIRGCQPKRTSQKSKANSTTLKPKGVTKAKRTKAKRTKAKRTKAKRTKSTNVRDNQPSRQNGTDMSVPSSSAAAEEDDTDAMDSTLTEAVSPNSAEDVRFEYEIHRLSTTQHLLTRDRTPNERAENDEAMRKMAEEIVSSHANKRIISIIPDCYETARRTPRSTRHLSRHHETYRSFRGYGALVKQD